MFTILDSYIKLRAYLSLSQPLSKFLAYNVQKGLDSGYNVDFLYENNFARPHVYSAAGAHSVAMACITAIRCCVGMVPSP